MKAWPTRVDVHVGDNHSAMIISHWPDGIRTCDWVSGVWPILKLMWWLIRSGVPVEVME